METIKMIKNPLFKRVAIMEVNPYVYFMAAGHSFVYADFKDTDSFIEGIVEYIFQEENLLNYAKRNNKISFSGTQKQYAKLYNNITTLQLFIKNTLLKGKLIL